jgi:hypothetical protein
VSVPPSPTLREQLWSKAAPSAILLALVAAAASRIVEPIKGAFWLCLAIVLAISASWLFAARRKVPAGARFGSRHLVAASVICALLACAAVGYQIYDWSQKGARAAEKRAAAVEKRLTDEEKLAASVSAGQDFSGFQAKLGVPTTKRRFGKYLIYQWERRRESLQAVVNKDGVVVSYAVYANTRNFHPTFAAGGKFMLNSTAVGRGLEAAPDAVAANFYCGAHQTGYFEKFGTTEAVGGRYFVLGIYNGGPSLIDAGAVCEAALDRGLSRCYNPSGDLNARNDLTSGVLSCIKSADVGRKLRSTATASVYIETAPYTSLLRVMLFPPAEAAVLSGG